MDKVLNTNSGQIKYLHPEDYGLEFATLLMVIAYNDILHFSPPSYISDAEMQKWKWQNLKANI